MAFELYSHVWLDDKTCALESLVNHGAKSSSVEGDRMGHYGNQTHTYAEFSSSHLAKHKEGAFR